ncbi:MAG: Rhomboid family intrarane serine protease, partial [Acidobacteriota bacterium]|nr:Rhomboid family intrarane serine protease [Acidobacteriota bacterium]
MIIPIGHEDQEVYKLPWMTFFLMAVCLVVHILTLGAMERLEEKGTTILQEMFEYYAQHPYLQLDPEVKKILLPNLANEDALMELMNTYKQGGAEPVDEEARAEQQQELDQMAREFKTLLDDIPYRKWGLTPARKTFLGFFTYIFLHSGWLHLIGNLFLFYLCGPFLEDRWGKIIYTPFFLLSGVFAAFMFAVHYPSFDGPLIGASGTVSGAMGAFLITNWKTKIHFFYFFSFIVRGTFSAPAWLMLPIWVLMEFYNARVMDTISYGSGGGGVAHWAHVWGFVFGVVFAAGMKYLKIEEKYINPIIQAEVRYVNKSYARYEEAMELRTIGKVDEAFAVLKEAVQMGGADSEVIETFWNVSLGVGKTHEAAPFFIRYIQKETINGQLDLAYIHHRQLKEALPEAAISNQSLLVLMEYLLQRDEKKEAGILAAEVSRAIDATAPVGLLLQFSDLALQIDPALAERAIVLCDNHPDIPGNKKEELKTKLAAAKARKREIEALAGSSMPEAQTQVRTEPEPSAPPEPLTIPGPQDTNINITVTSVVPLEIKDTVMKVQLDKVGARALPLNKIKAISSAHITSQGERKFLLFDLFLDDPAEPPPNNVVRTIRILSLHFNARVFFPEVYNPVEAYRKFIATLLQCSGARP